MNRSLKVYAFDPSQGRNLGNHMTVQVPYETLRPGPIGQRIAVIDYDASNGRYYRPVDLDAVELLLQNGLDPSAVNPEFHQQMVYAVAWETVTAFENALGREVRWRFPRPAEGRFRKGRKETPPESAVDEKTHLRIFPHGMQAANAYYSRELGALLFGYFETRPDGAIDGPKQRVFTCLSHDIVAHETTHALVDVLRSHYVYSGGPDTAAFHEAFADIIALFQHFSVKEALLDTIQRTGGLLHRVDLEPEAKPGAAGPRIQVERDAKNPLIELARQFGVAMGMRQALRSALGRVPEPDLLARLSEPHERGAILVAAVFDAFFSSYLRRTRDLMRIARAGGSGLSPGDLHPDLAERLAREAAKVASHFLKMCIRALDYCPPVDITFGDFLRALVTVDRDLVPEDNYRYRDTLIEAFQSRGIRSEDVTSVSEGALAWEPFDSTSAAPVRLAEVLGPRYPADRRSLGPEAWRFLHGHVAKNARALGLTSGSLYVRGFAPSCRVEQNGRVRQEYVFLVHQSRVEALDPKDSASPPFVFRGGATIILDEAGRVRYSIPKRLDDAVRLSRLRQYAERVLSGWAGAPYARSTKPLPLEDMLCLDFNLLHRGY